MERSDALLLQTGMFIHPAFVWVALGSASLPVLIHLINRRRYRPQPWAAMSFLLTARRQTARRVALEQWLLLLIRMALMTLFGLAVARPFFPALPLASLGRSRTHHILLLDNSCSMNALDPPDGTTGSARSVSRFDQAIRTAQELLSALPTGDAVSLVTLAAPATVVIGHATYDRRAATEKLRTLTATRRATDVAGGLTEALEILKKSDFAPGNRMVYVIGDTPALTWLGADAPEHGLIRAATVRKRSLISSVSKTAPSRSPQKQGESPAEVDERRVLRLARRVAADAALVFVHIGSNEAANVAVTDLRATTGVAGPEIPLRLLVDVGNFSDTARRGLMLQVGIDSKGLRQMPVDAIDPWQSRTLSLSLPLGSPGPHVVHAAVSPGPSLARSQVRDALPIDDTRLLAIDVLEDVPVLLVDGKPGLTPLDGSAGYLSTALAPRTDTGSEGTFSPTIVSDRELAFEPLGDYGVVALCNVPQLDTGEWQRLEGFVADGGGLLLFGGDAIDTANYNTQGYRGGAGLLPCRLSGPIGDLQSHDRFVRLEPGSFTHPVLRDFSDHPESGLFRARVQAFLAVEKVLPDTEVPLRYTDSHAAMILRRFGRGSVALFTTSADMSWTNLPAKGDYVSLIVNLVSYLTPSSSQGRTLLVGETISEPLAPDEASLPLRVTLPDGEVIRAAPVRKRLAAVPSTGGPSLPLRFLSGGVEDRGSFLSLPVEQVGAYELSIGPKAVTWVANIDAGESALRGAGERELRKALHCPFTYVAAPDLMRATITRRTSHEFATRLLYAVFALLVLESWLAGKFGAYR